MVFFCKFLIETFYQIKVLRYYVKNKTHILFTTILVPKPTKYYLKEKNFSRNNRKN